MLILIVYYLLSVDFHSHCPSSAPTCSDTIVIHVTVHRDFSGANLEKVGFVYFRPDEEMSHDKSKVLRVLRWCYTRRFATTIFSPTQHCNLAATLFRMVTALFQHCNTVLSYKSSLRIVRCNSAIMAAEKLINKTRIWPLPKLLVNEKNLPAQNFVLLGRNRHMNLSCCLRRFYLFLWIYQKETFSGE